MSGGALHVRLGDGCQGGARGRCNLLLDVRDCFSLRNISLVHVILYHGSTYRLRRTFASGENEDAGQYGGRGGDGDGNRRHQRATAFLRSLRSSSPLTASQTREGTLSSAS